MSDEANTRRGVLVGCQGWNYDDWTSKPGVPLIYPQNTRASEMLQVYARAFATVEVDSTFYAIPSAPTIENWARRTPPGFTFSLKLPREITHERAFGTGSDLLLAEFTERARLLGDKLGAVLIQLPPQYEATRENRRALEALLPRFERGVRFAIEFRDRSWAEYDIAGTLAEFGVAVALVEGRWIDRRTLWQMSAGRELDFAYVRWMGERDLTRFDVVQRPQDANLELWWRACEKLEGRAAHVYAYFSNFYEGYAPASANKLKKMLGQEIVEGGDLEDQGSLF